ncbi:hypothetical protein CRYUN_Cryun08bG0090200 [Craigia yunnanensis]
MGLKFYNERSINHQLCCPVLLLLCSGCMLLKIYIALINLNYAQSLEFIIPLFFCGFLSIQYFYLLFQHYKIDQDLKRSILINAALSVAGFFVTQRMIPVASSYVLKRGLFGFDINKKGTPQGTVKVPESLGIVVGIVFLVLAILFQYFNFAADSNWLVEYNAALASICFMILLGFVDDFLDVPWRVLVKLGSGQIEGSLDLSQLQTTFFSTVASKACFWVRFGFRYPSSVFVGDTYTYFAGMTMAVVGILGHYRCVPHTVSVSSETLLIFFLPQVLNFLLSLPQLSGYVKCPQHHLPRFNPETRLLTGTRDGMLVNFYLKLFGPKPEKSLCIYLLIFQALGCCFCFMLRYFLAGWYK